MPGRARIKTGEKKCTGCGITKTATDFYQDRGGLRSRCKACYAIHNKDQREKHHEKRLADSRMRGCGWARCDRSRWAPTEREKHNGYLLRTYGISLAEYEALFEAQGNVCAICRETCNRKTTTRLCVDHDHATGMVRGLLCFQCNVGLGKFKEDVQRLKSAIEYLEM
jgi:CRISPR/Cas system-associated protein Cas10 (large subunit of type III CRISPR-Cas system)